MLLQVQGEKKGNIELTLLLSSKLTFRVHQRDGFQRCGLQQLVEFPIGGMGRQELDSAHHDVLNKDVILAAGTGTQQ